MNCPVGRSNGLRWRAPLTKWLVSLPPTLFLLVFFLVPALLMVGASFQQPGDFGGLVPAVQNG